MSLKTINKIANFGVFRAYAKPQDLASFAEKNIIYGWNYSGKTTLSRLFHVLETKQLHGDYQNARFTFDDGSPQLLTEANMDGDNKVIRVFNSDFVERNLSWHGAAFNPVLVLGEESIEAEKAIDAKEILVQRCRDGFKRIRLTKEKLTTEIADKKTKAARTIKTTLSLVETFTAAHVNAILGEIDLVGIHRYILSQRDVSNLLGTALSSDKDKLDFMQKFPPPPDLTVLEKDAKELLSQIPKFSSVIDYLRTHPAVANWVEQGLHLHHDHEKCEFCGNELDPQRMGALGAHFSKDLANYRNKLAALLNSVKNYRVPANTLSKGMFYADLRDQAIAALGNVNLAITEFNTQLDLIQKAIELKVAAPFEVITFPTISNAPIQVLVKVSITLNALVEVNNQRSANFGAQKRAAIDKLKRHYIAEFSDREELEKLADDDERYARHQNTYQIFANRIKEQITALKAKISLAQRGREEINGHISNLLGSNTLQIEVVEEENSEKFRLVRGEQIAKNLSEGEKTAIAFSFFLSKLRELKKLDDCIVYIDDPISSLDSNHIFQVNALLREAFFHQELPNDEWKTKCKQIFISTHNFEFFSLLRELPGNANKTRFYQVKRVSATDSVLVNLPSSITKYGSEYHYLYSVIRKFSDSPDKADLELLLSVPNAVRRFVELYTFSRLPTSHKVTVDQRAEIIFGAQKAKRILKVLHHFSHLNNIERLSKNTDLICDIENAVNDLLELIKLDKLHFDALEEAFSA